MSVVPGGQEVGPDVEGLIGELEEAPDAICGWAAGVSVPWDDAILMKNLQGMMTVLIPWQSLALGELLP